MITRNALTVTALATVSLAPFAAITNVLAQAATEAPALFAAPPFHGEIQIDVGGVMGNNANQAGRYNGLNSTGPIGGVGEIAIMGAAPWNSDETRYYEFNGENLFLQGSNGLGTGIGRDSGWSSATHNGLANNGSLELKAGDRGIWDAALFYDTITYTGNVIYSLYNVGPNNNQAILNNGLAPWGGATATKAGAVTAFTVAGLNATGAMRPFQTGTRRDLIGGNFKLRWNDWTFTGAYRHEHKEGTMEQSFDGPYGGTAFTQPISYDTDRYDMSAAYTTRHLQGMVQYTFSHFVDNAGFVNLPYPMSNTSAPFQRSGVYTAPPNNDAHYLTFMVGTDVVPLTHINANARIGMELQDDTFAANTGDPNPPASAIGPGLLRAGTLQGTTTNSPGMVAEVYQLKLSASSRPLSNVDTRIYYGLDGRDVSLNQYKVNVGGTGGVSDSVLTGNAFVVPQNWLKQNGGAEVGYRFLPEYNSKITVGYQYDAIERSNAQVGHSSTNTATLAVLSEFGPQVNGKLSFEYADRTGSVSYLRPWANLLGTQNTTPYYSGAFYQAPMTSEAVTLRADYTPMDTLSSSLFVRFKNEDYSYSPATAVGNAIASSAAGTGTVPLTGTGAGVKQDYNLSVGPDFNYRPSKSLNFHFFYTYEMLFYNNIGSGACGDQALANVVANCKGSAGYFQNKDTSSTHTVGLSGEWTINEKLKLKAEYTFAYGTVMFGQFNGVFVASPTLSYQNVSNYPDIDSLMNNIRVTATYELMPNISLIVQGLYTSFHNNDWNDTANPVQGAGTTAVSILTPGYNSPNYSIAALLAGVKFRF